MSVLDVVEHVPTSQVLTDEEIVAGVRSAEEQSSSVPPSSEKEYVEEPIQLCLIKTLNKL